MAYSLINVINKVLKRANTHSGTDLTAVTGNDQQADVDIAIQVINEIVRQQIAGGSWQGEITEGTITLTTGGREYSLASDFVSMADDVLVNAADERLVIPYPGGYYQMRRDQPDPSNFTGFPEYWVLTPTSVKIRFDKTQTATENNKTLLYHYNKRIGLTQAADTFPVDDEVLDDLVPAIAEYYKRSRQGLKEYDKQIFHVQMGEAAAKISKVQPRTHYGHKVRIPRM